MILVDSSVWVDFFKGVKSVAAFKLYESLETDLIITGDIILAEVLQVFPAESDFVIARKTMEIFPCFSLSNPDLSVKVIDNIYKLRSPEIASYKPKNAIIATFCIEKQIALLHNDPGYKPFERYLGLKTK